ncbi:MAG: SIMPL domain-containing protein [Minisyncoccia bacterium]
MINNKLKNILILSGIIFFISAAISLLIFVSLYSEKVEQNITRSFQVQGEGKVTAIPDTAILVFGVITQGGMDLNAIQNSNSQKANKAIDFVKSQGIQDLDIKTISYNIEPRYQYQTCNNTICTPAQIIGYNVNQNIQIKVYDFSKLGNIISGVVQNGANSISSLSFTIKKLDDLQEEARQKAIVQAQEKAQDIAHIAGFKLGKLLTINESVNVPQPQVLMNYAKLESAMSSIPNIQSGSQEVKVDVYLTYAIQ